MASVSGLAAKADIVNTVFLKILQRYKFNNGNKHLVFEGFEDESFYMSHFPPGSDYESFVTNGKPNSIELYNSIDWTRYSKSRLLFFIDRDFDRILEIDVPSDTNIYETTFYSIENYIVTENMLRRVIREILHFYEADEINEICTLFNDALAIFVEKVRPVIIWILVARANGLRPNLNDVDLSVLFDLSNNLEFVDYRVDKISFLEKRTQVNTPKTTLSTYRHFYVKLTTIKNYKVYVRGKFELWFFLRFLNKLHLYLSGIGHKKSQKTQFNSANTIEVLGPRVPCPKRLKEFIQKAVA